MRLPFIAFISCLGMLAAAPQCAVSQVTVQPTKAVDSSLTGQTDPAEKHARRTACLKDAKSKKLVGAQKTAYVADCMASNPPMPSSSSTSP